MVVGYAISATRDYLKLHMLRTLKAFFCNTHAETRKLWKRSAGLPPLEAIPVDHFTSRPLPHFTRPPRCPLHSLRFPGMQTRCRLVLASRLPVRAAPTSNPHSSLQAGAQPPATSCLGAFGRRPVERAGLSLLPASKKTSTRREELNVSTTSLLYLRKRALPGSPPPSISLASNS